MTEQTLKFDNIRVNKKEFNKSKQPIDLMSVNIDQTVVSDKFKHNDEQHDLTPRIYVPHKITIALKFMSYINQKLQPSCQTALNLCLT